MLTRTSSSRELIISATAAFAAVSLLIAAFFWNEIGHLGWRSTWALVTGASMLVLALAMWRLDRAFDLASFVAAVIATAGLGASIPSFLLGLRAIGDGALARPHHATFDAVFGIACAIYLSFVLVGLLARARGDSAGLMPRRVDAPPPGNPIAGY